MQREQLRADNGRDGRAGERGPRAGVVEPEGASGLGDVAKDALEHVKVIVSDSVAIGKLEARRLALRAEEAGRDLAPRVAVGALASLVGLAGIVLALIALFIALEEVIPSTAVRLAIFAAAFLLIAAAGSFFALRPGKARDDRALVVISPVERIAPRPPPDVADRAGEVSQISR
jgi:hypothetical protein